MLESILKIHKIGFSSVKKKLATVSSESGDAI